MIYGVIFLMFKKINSCVCSIKRRVICEINAVNKGIVIFATAVIFIAGLAITLHGMCDVADSTLVFPRAVPSAFFLVLGRFLIHFMLALILGILLAVGDRSAQGCAFRAAVFVSALVLCEMIWISVFYSFAIPFFSFLLTVFMLILAVCACLSVTGTVFTASLVLYLIWRFLRSDAGFLFLWC